MMLILLEGLFRGAWRGSSMAGGDSGRLSQTWLGDGRPSSPGGGGGPRFRSCPGLRAISLASSELGSSIGVPNLFWLVRYPPLKDARRAFLARLELGSDVGVLYALRLPRNPATHAVAMLHEKTARRRSSPGCGVAQLSADPQQMSDHANPGVTAHSEFTPHRRAQAPGGRAPPEVRMSAIKTYSRRCACGNRELLQGRHACVRQGAHHAPTA